MTALIGALCALGSAAGWALATVYLTKGGDRFSVLSINFLKGMFAFPFSFSCFCGRPLNWEVWPKRIPSLWGIWSLVVW